MADVEEVIDWPAEVIPAADKLYMRVHRMYVRNGDFVVGAFRDQGGAMSTDWEKYSTPQETRDRARVAADNGVIQMVSGDVAAIPDLTVAHTPDVVLRVRAHTDVAGEKTPAVRVKLKRISHWTLALV